MVINQTYYTYATIMMFNSGKSGTCCSVPYSGSSAKVFFLWRKDRKLNELVLIANDVLREKPSKRASGTIARAS